MKNSAVGFVLDGRGFEPRRKSSGLIADFTV